MCVVNLATTKIYDVRIDRRTRWGNRFVMHDESQRENVVRKHREWLWQEIKAGRITKGDLAQLHGKTLACWCAPKACHGDTLLRAARWAADSL